MAGGRDEILELRASYMRCQDVYDAEGCVRHWDKDGVLMQAGEPAIRGTDALLAWYKAAFERISLEFETFYGEVQVGDEWSFASGTYRGRVRSKASGEAVEDTGNFLEIHRRQADGSWKFAYHISCSDRPGH
jgi:ketosteroid isomerase-like protein